MLYIYFLEKKHYYSHSNRSSKHTTLPNFFWSCYSHSLYLEKTIPTLNEFFYLNKSYNSIKNNSFSLHLTKATNIHNGYKHNNPFSQTSLNSSIIKIQTQKHNLKINQIITIKAKKKDKSHLTHLATLVRKMSGGGVEGATWHSERRFCACLCPSINGEASKISLTCSFSVSYHIES